MATKDRALNVAVVGLGHLHPRSYMPLFLAVPGVRPVAVVERDGELRSSFCADFGLQGYESLEPMLKAHSPDLAAIFLPHDDCPAAAEACARAGAHIMVEKPMASTSEGASRIVAAARAAGVLLTTGYCWRMHPAARELKRLVGSGVLGRIIGAEARCAAGRLHRYIDGKAPWILERARSGGGPMYNLGVHWIDLLRWVLEDEVVEVSGRNVKVNTVYDIEDNSFAHLKFSRGTIAALDISYTVPDSFPHGRDLYVSVRGTQGVVSWAPAYEGAKDVLAVASDHPDFAGSPRREIELELDPVKGYSGYMGAEYVRGFVEAVRGRKAPAVSGEDGVAALKVVEAVYRSDAEKRWVAVLP
jgi:predicted dehydrogenase